MGAAKQRAATRLLEVPVREERALAQHHILDLEPRDVAVEVHPVGHQQRDDRICSNRTLLRAPDGTTQRRHTLWVGRDFCYTAVLTVRLGRRHDGRAVAASGRAQETELLGRCHTFLRQLPTGIVVSHWAGV